MVTDDLHFLWNRLDIFAKKKKSKMVKKEGPSRHKYSHPAAIQETNFF